MVLKVGLMIKWKISLLRIIHLRSPHREKVTLKWMNAIDREKCIRLAPMKTYHGYKL